MASITVVVHRITATYDNPYNLAGYELGNYVHCILDDVTLAITVQIRNSPTIGGGSLVNTPVSGPSAFFGDGGSMTALFTGTPTPQPYWSRCDGTTLRRVVVINSFPYAQVGSTPGSSQCVITPVCDLTISDDYSVTPASGPTTADGAVTISATSSNGTIKYSMIQNFDYSLQGQTSPTFSGVLPGEYTIYAKDPIGCTDEIVVTIPVTEVYGVKYRFEWGVVGGPTSRYDIEERAFAGSITEPVVHGVQAFVHRCIGEDDKYHTLWYGNSETNFLTQTPLQWDEFFTDDDKLYKGKHYRYEDGDWQLKSVGFVVPALPSEPYLNPPFYTNIHITDRLGNLKDFDFLDDDGNQLYQSNSLIFIIAMILRKTGLNLSIRSGIDLLETTMNDADTDDVLAQTYVDCRIFYDEKNNPDKCDEVIDKILTPFGAYIKQAFGYFWILRQESAVGDIAYRQFDSDGEYESEGTFESLVGIFYPQNVTEENQYFFRDAVQLKQTQTNYGKFIVSHDALPDNNLIDSGSFESQYLTEVGGQLGFLDWNVFLAQAGVRYGYAAVKNGDSKGAFYFNYQQSLGAQADNLLYSKKIRVKNSVFDFSFQYNISPTFTNLPFIRIAYRIKAEPVGGGTTYYYSKFGVWDSTERVNELFVSSYDSWQKFEKRFPTFPISVEDGYDVTIQFYSHNHWGVDYNDDDFSELKAVATTSDYITGKKIYYYDDDDDLLRAYELTGSNEAESLPDVVRPDDYSALDAKVWKLIKTLNLGPNQSFVNEVQIDNVVFNQLVLIVTPVTLYSDAPNPITYELIPNSLNPRVFEKEVFIGDVPDAEDEVTQARIPNPEIYRGWFRLADGTPTRYWKRREVDEEVKLLDLLVHDYSAQYREPTRKINCTLMGNGYLSPIHSVEDFDNDNKKYIITGYEMDDRENSFRVILSEVVTGADGLPPPENNAFSLGFTVGFEA